MKRSVYSSCIFLLTAMAFLSCQDLYAPDSSSVVYEEKNTLQSASDSVWTILGVWSEVSEVGERCLLMGELRGDLMKTTDDAPACLQELEAFNFDKADAKDVLAGLYAVVADCDYAIEHMDTSLLAYETKVMMPEFAQLKTWRAWAYWQIALQTGAAVMDGTEVGQEALAQRLIQDLQPYAAVRELDYGTIDGFASARLVLPVNMMIGDLYLFLNDYEKAAEAYMDVIDRHGLYISESYTSRWIRTTREEVAMSANDAYSGEMLTGMLYSSNPAGYHPQLVRYTYNDVPALVPSEAYVKQMDGAIHYHGERNSHMVLGYFKGDLRGQAITSKGTVSPGAYGRLTLNGKEKEYIYKYMLATASSSAGYDPQNKAIAGQLIFTRYLPVVRTPHVYLRLAEALNRTNRPTMAFSVLKYGLNASTLNDTTKVNASEVEFPYTVFANSRYDSNVGTASRGRGYGIRYDAEDYLIPELPSMADSVLFVEDCIVDEMAAETAFEGNRFFDLLRVARHRNQMPEYMTEKVSQKYYDQASMKEKLADESAWYVK